MSGSQLLLLGGTPQVVSDPNFEYTTLLLPGNGTNGAQNNTFLDSSTNNFTITRNGNTTQGTFSPFSQTGWGNYFDGSGDYLTFPNNTAFAFGTGAFTIEFWVNGPLNNDKFLLSGRAAIGTMHITTGGSGGSTAGALRYVGSSTITSGSAVVTNDTWNHCAIVRDGSNNITLYVNGTSVGTGTDSTNYTTTSGTWYIASNDVAAPANILTAYLSNLRIVKGTAVYTSNFTPSTTPLTAISGTSLLTCQSNRFIDNSTNAFAITRNGDVSVQAFSPFNPTAAWSASTNGGSGYFDGTGDYLNGPATGQFAPTGNFTISMWIYPTSFAASFYVLAGSWNTGTSNEWLIQYDNTGAIRFLTTTDSTFSAAGVIKLNQWQFISISRTGSTLTGYVNGTSFRSYTLTGTVGVATKIVYIGAQIGTTWPYIGYMADFRLVDGSAESATPPTSPATAISGTNMLLNYTNAGIYDATSKNDLETVGNAQISTTQSKFGGSSMYFDGTGDYLLSNAATTNLYAFGTGDFTVEMWIRFSAIGTDVYHFYDSRPASTDGAYPTLRTNASSQLEYIANSAVRITGATLTTNTWYHIAVARAGTSTKLFVDGVQSGSTYTDSTNYLNAALRPLVGGSGFHVTTLSLNGYIDDLRVTKGVARYTANFTAPTAAFPLL